MELTLKNPLLTLSNEEQERLRNGTGLTSYSSYQNPAYWEVMSNLFNVRSHERLIGLIQDGEGIKAVLSTAKDKV